MKLRSVSLIFLIIAFIAIVVFSLMPTLNKARMPDTASAMPKERTESTIEKKRERNYKKDNAEEMEDDDSDIDLPAEPVETSAAPDPGAGQGNSVEDTDKLIEFEKKKRLEDYKRALAEKAKVNTSKLEAIKKAEGKNQIDSQLDNLFKGTIAFNTPKQLSYKETTTIHLVLSPKEKDELVAKLVEGNGPVVTEAVKYSKFVEARIEGVGFDIQSVSSERQPVSQKDNTEWRWQVTPKKVGKQSLFLSVYAVVSVDGEKHERLIKTFTKDLVIDIKFLDHPVEFFKYKPTVGLLFVGVGVSFLFFGAGYVRFIRRKRAAGQKVSIGTKDVEAEIFISYSSKDRDYVSSLVDSLRAKGLSVWMDVGGIAPAALWSNEIVNALKSAKLVVLVGSVNSFESHNVVKEVSLASEQQTPIIPLIIDDSEIPDKLAYQLAGVQVMRASENDLEQSVNRIDEIIKGSTA